MRDLIRQAIGDQPASHFGLGYDLFSPRLRADGTPDPDSRNAWIGRCAKTEIDADYRYAYDRWRSSFPADQAIFQEVVTRSRLLIGHGNSSGADVGLTVHHTWGVPMIPGSALKGLTAHYVDTVYGDDAPNERRVWRGPTWTGRRIAKGDGAGDEYGYLFGAPEVDGEPNSARGGAVEFHDALYMPGPIRNDRPFARDVLTVHQKPYYDTSGQNWPNDWTSPTPIGFVTVRPGARFLLVVTGPREWRELAMRLLLNALADWGIGGKTSAGYGRLAPPDARGHR